MRFDRTSKPLPAIGWRTVLLAAALVPSLLLLAWSAKQSGTRRPDPVLAGQSADNARRLQRLLTEPASATDEPLRDDAVRMVAPQSGTDLESERSGRSDRPSRSRTQFDRSLLAQIADNTFGVSRAEKPAYDSMLTRARELPNEELDRAALSDVPIAVLMLEAERFRGEAISVTGDLRRLRKLAPDAAAEDSATYEAWLFTADSGLHPYRIVCCDVPVELPVSDQFHTPPRVSATGFFFKRYSYATGSDFHTAPLLIAKTLTLVQTPRRFETKVTPQNNRWLMLFAIGVLSLLGLGVVYHCIRRSARTSRLSTSESDGSETPDFHWLDDSSPERHA